MPCHKTSAINSYPKINFHINFSLWLWWAPTNSSSSSRFKVRHKNLLEENVSQNNVLFLKILIIQDSLRKLRYSNNENVSQSALIREICFILHLHNQLIDWSESETLREGSWWKHWLLLLVHFTILKAKTLNYVSVKLYLHMKTHDEWLKDSYPNLNSQNRSGSLGKPQEYKKCNR